ncbi:MAG: hypothetical protein AAF352_06120, partial [Pseudomonadota bacterium]
MTHKYHHRTKARVQRLLLSSIVAFALISLWPQAHYAEQINANDPVINAEVADIIPKVFVDDDYILLGQVFTSAGKYADRRIAASPPPGQTVVFRAKWLWRVAYRYQIPWRPYSEEDTVSVTRNSRKITSEEVVAALEAHLRVTQEKLTAEMDRGIVELTIQSGAQHVLLPTNISHDISFRDVTIDLPNKRLSATAVIAGGTASEVRQYVGGQLQTFQHVWVPARQIGTQDVISQSDLQQIRMPKDRIIQTAAM